MRIRTSLVTLSLVLFGILFGCYEDRQESRGQVVSIFELIVSPETYKNERVVTTGFLTDGPDPALYATRELAAVFDPASKIDVEDMLNGEISASDCGGKIVRVYGKFVERGPEKSMYLVDLKRIWSPDSVGDCWVSVR